MLLHLKGVIGLKGWSKTAVPIRWYDESFPVGGPAELVARSIDPDGSKQAAWDIDDNRAILELAPSVDIRIGFKVPKQIPKKSPHARSSRRVRFRDEVATSLSVV